MSIEANHPSAAESTAIHKLDPERDAVAAASR